jgi:hypothetical protein
VSQRFQTSVPPRSNSVGSVFSRTGDVVAANGDYNASQITFTPAGTIAAVTVQAAIEEVAAEAAAGGGFTIDDVVDALVDGFGTQWDVTPATGSTPVTIAVDRMVKYHVDSYSSNITMSLLASVGEFHQITLAGNPVLRASNVETEKQLRVRLIQDATGGRTVDWSGLGTITWLTHRGLEPRLSPAPGDEDTIWLICTNDDAVNSYANPTWIGWPMTPSRRRLLTDTASPFTAGTDEWQWFAVADVGTNVAKLDIVGNGSVTAGTFTITVDGQTTAPIAYNATGWEIYQAVLALAAVADGDIVLDASESTQRLSTGATISFLWIGSDGYNTHTTTVNSGGLTGGTYSAADFSPSGSFPSISGNYKLTFGGQATANIAVTANAAAIQSALESLSTIGSGNVSVTGGPLDTKGIVIQFTGTLAATDVSGITMSTLPTFPGSGSVPSGVLRAGVANSGNEAAFDWTRNDDAKITVTGSGTHTINLTRIIPQERRVITITDSGASGTLVFSANVILVGGSPSLPASGKTDLYEFYALSTTQVLGKLIQAGYTL